MQKTMMYHNQNPDLPAKQQCISVFATMLISLQCIAF